MLDFVLTLEAGGRKMPQNFLWSTWKTESDGFIFLQETHSSVKDEKIWNDEFGGQLVFSHGKTNSCGVAIGFVGTKALNILNIRLDDSVSCLLTLTMPIPSQNNCIH